MAKLAKIIVINMTGGMTIMNTSANINYIQIYQSLKTISFNGQIFLTIFFKSYFFLRVTLKDELDKYKVPLFINLF